MRYNEKLIVQDKYLFLSQFQKLSLDIKTALDLEPSKKDILLFTGSIIDKSEIHYRELINKEALYFTIINDDINEQDIDPFWHIHTIILKESFANQVLSLDKIEDFLNIIKTIKDTEPVDTIKYIDDIKPIYSEFNNYKPINSVDYQPKDDFLGSLASGFRGIYKKEVEYKLKYTAHDKKNMKAIIARFSSKINEKTYQLIKLTNIGSEEELSDFFSKNKDEIEIFLEEESDIKVIIFNNKEIILTNISSLIDNDIYLIISYNNKKVVVLFQNDKLETIEEIDNFLLIKNYANKDISLSNLENYKKFIKSIKAFDFSVEFQTIFSKIIQSTSNTFLKQQLNKYDTPFEALQNFHIYLANESKKQNQLSMLLQIIDNTKDISTLNDKFVINFYFYIRNTVLKNNDTFLEEFDDYKKQIKIKIDILKSIEKCIGDISDFEEDVESNSFKDTRHYNLNYLKYLKIKMLSKNCLKYLNKLDKILLEMDNSIVSFEEDIHNIDGISILEEEFSNESIQHLTYINKFLFLPIELEKSFVDKLNIQFLLDLITMWSIQFLASEEKNNSLIKNFIQKNYLSNRFSKEEKEKWRYITTNVIYKIYAKNISYNKSMLVESIGLEQLNSSLIYEFNLSGKHKNSFISKGKYKSDDFITLKASHNKLNKFFIKKNNIQMISYIEELFGKNGLIIHLLEEENIDLSNSLEFLKLKELLCKGRISQSKNADNLCKEIIYKLKRH